MEKICFCGHTEDEHEEDGGAFFNPCTIKGCTCIDFEENEED